MSTMDLWISGKVLPGVDPNQAARSFATITGLTVDQARTVITCGTARLARRGLPLDKAQVFVRKLGGLGIGVMLKATPPNLRGWPPRRTARVPAGKDREFLALALSSGTQMEVRKRKEEAKSPEESELIDLFDDSSDESFWNGTPSRASVPRGLSWFWESGRLIFEAPVAWGVTILAICAVAALGNVYSPLFTFGWCLVLPILAGGIAIMAEMQHDGEDFHILYLFKGLWERPVQLILLVLLISLYAVPVLAIMQMIGGQAAQDLVHSHNADPLALIVDAAGDRSILTALLAGLILLIPAFVVSFFAPTLVTLAGFSATKSVVRALWAGLRNIAPFLVNLVFLTLFGCFAFFVAYVFSEFFSGWSLEMARIILTVLLSVFWLLITVVCQLMGYVATFDLFYPEETC